MLSANTRSNSTKSASEKGSRTTSSSHSRHKSHRSRGEVPPFHLWDIPLQTPQQQWQGLAEELHLPCAMHAAKLQIVELCISLCSS